MESRVLPHSSSSTIFASRVNQLSISTVHSWIIFVNGGVEKLIDAVASRLINFSIGKFSRPINHDIFFLVYDFFLDFSIIFITKSCCKLINFFVSTTSTIRFYHIPSSRSTIFVDFFARTWLWYLDRNSLASSAVEEFLRARVFDRNSARNEFPNR